jgi:hypothetical protein
LLHDSLTWDIVTRWTLLNDAVSDADFVQSQILHAILRRGRGVLWWMWEESTVSKGKACSPCLDLVQSCGLYLPLTMGVAKKFLPSGRRQV